MNSEHDLSQGTSLLVFQWFVLHSMDVLRLLGFSAQLEGMAEIADSSMHVPAWSTHLQFPILLQSFHTT